jgi:hypothetical protein
MHSNKITTETKDDSKEKNLKKNERNKNKQKIKT